MVAAARAGLVTTQGDTIAGYLVGDGEKKVIVVHEIFGVNAHIRQQADRVAEAGFTAFAIDLFDGRSTEDLQEGFALGGSLDWSAAVRSIGRAAEALATKPGARVGILGFCLGGALALVAAANFPLRACVCFYGVPTAERADLTRIRAKVLAHFGTRDQYIANEQVDALEALIAHAGVPAQFHRYDAEHGFIREQPDGDASTRAWARTIAFLGEELGV